MWTIFQLNSRQSGRHIAQVGYLPMSETWSAVTGLHSQRIEWEMLLSQLPCGHPDKMPWLIVAYALCTTLALHSDDSTNYASLPRSRSRPDGKRPIVCHPALTNNYCERTAGRWPNYFFFCFFWFYLGHHISSLLFHLSRGGRFCKRLTVAYNYMTLWQLPGLSVNVSCR